MKTAPCSLPVFGPATSTRLLAMALLLSLCGCAAVVERARSRFADNLGAGILNHEDPQTVAEGLPAYLLLLDGLLEGDPESVGTLRAASRLYGAYGGNFVDNPARQRRLASRGFDYARRAACIEAADLCSALQQPYDEMAAMVARQPLDRAPLLYELGAAWAGLIQADSSDYAAIAAIPRVELLLGRAVDLDRDLDHGMPLVYLGVLNSLRPPAVGGEPERGREYFESAIAVSEGRNLMAKTLFARHYARLVFDRELHDRLLQEVIDADPTAPGLTLINTLAQQQAATLLASSGDYF